MQVSLNLSFPNPSLIENSAIPAIVNRFAQALADPFSPVRAVRTIPSSEGEFIPIPEALQPPLIGALRSRGIEQLYSHQALALELALAGRNVAVVTPTASGKTLCYNLPVLDTLTRLPDSRALYLFPTKALAEDQLHELQSMLDAAGSELTAFTYDGDTPQDARRAIRERARIVLSNPDMLHSGILPHHTKWAKCFENLRFIVIDELHYYRGVYGSHVANVLRRLRRLCEFYGSKPQFVCCSATIANPKELAEALTESTFELVDRNGAPRGEKHFVLYNPPVINRQLGIRRSYLHETRRIATELIDRGQQTLVFANNRLATEVLLTYLKDACERHPRSTGAVRGYRGGYLPKERRQIERQLRDGEIRAVVATNALELGIDIGGLDAVVMAGYPGTIASTWQRAGRAGRRRNTSLAILVASSAPVDQYVVEHPEYFFGQSPEHAHINANNLEILINHLKCAAFELPLKDGERFGPHDTSGMCRFLEELGLLHLSGGCWHWTSDSYPADAVSLRSVTSDNFVVIDTTGEHRIIGEVSFSAALTTLHEKAIYLHDARQHQVERFDYEGRKAYVKQVDSDYFTDAIDYTEVKILEEFESAPASGPASMSYGDVRVTTQVVGFKKIRFYTLENVGSGKLSMPEQEMHTTSFWISLSAALLESLGLGRDAVQGGITGLASAMRGVASLMLMCDPRDLGIAISSKADPTTAYTPDVFLYDSYPGGVGLSAPLFSMRDAVISSAIDLIEACPCESGCPSCTGPVGETGEGGKHAALQIARRLRVA